jgi:D-alanyl-D-alanine dipeptidase
MTVTPLCARTRAVAVATDLGTRLDRAARAAADAGLDGLVVTPGADLRYLAGYQPIVVTERLTALVVVAGREPVLVVPSLERPDAERSPAAALVRLVDWADGTEPYTEVAALLGAGRFGISDAAWAAHVLALQRAEPAVELVALSEALPTLRAVKEPEELDALARAAAAADAAFADLLRVPFGGRAEREVAGDLREALLAHGHDTVEFTLVASGPNGANPHYEDDSRTIEQGDLVVLDFGGRVDGYYSDITRTVAVGEPSAEQREVYDVVRAAQQAGVDAVAPGVACEDVDRAARAVIEEAGYGERFIHRTGHGIGAEVHEPPYIVAGNRLTLEPGMTFSVEPGIYLPGRFGVRVEDIVAVTEDGVRRLNEATRDLQTVA